MCSIAIYFPPSNLLFCLTQEKNIWGPFLVVAPASVLNNWADEISRFCPDLKTLPYWGGLQERMVLRKNINPKRLYRRYHTIIDSPLQKNSDINVLLGKCNTIVLLT